MDAEQLRHEYAHFEQRLQELLAAHQRLRTALAREQAEKKALQTHIADLKAQLQGFQNQAKLSKIVTMEATGSRETAVLQQQIDACLQEIDRCLAYLRT